MSWRQSRLSSCSECVLGGLRRVEGANRTSELKKLPGGFEHGNIYHGTFIGHSSRALALCFGHGLKETLMIGDLFWGGRKGVIYNGYVRGVNHNLATVPELAIETDIGLEASRSPTSNQLVIKGYVTPAARASRSTLERR